MRALNVASMVLFVMPLACARGASTPTPASPERVDVAIKGGDVVKDARTK